VAILADRLAVQAQKAADFHRALAKRTSSAIQTTEVGR
jgi:hypothetical protein